MIPFLEMTQLKKALDHQICNLECFGINLTDVDSSKWVRAGNHQGNYEVTVILSFNEMARFKGFKRD